MVSTRREFLAGGISTALSYSLLGCRGRTAQEAGLYDACVIGSGFAGTYLALTLVSHGLRTIMLEAGAADGAIDQRRLFPVENSGEIKYPANRTRAIAPGGTSRLWSGVLSRLRPSDFRAASEFGMDVDWPITYGLLAPYYCEAERLLSATGHVVVPDAEPPRKCPYPSLMEGVYKSPQLEYDGKSLPFFLNAFSYRNAGPVRLADLEIPEFERSPMATLLSGHRVARLVTTDGKSITYAEVQTPSGDRRSIRARCFVVAAGVIESARLLLLSRSKWFPNGLGNASGLVGCNFIAHPSFAWHFTPARRLDASEGSHRSYALNDWARRHGMNAYHCQLHVDSDRTTILKMQPEMQPRLENRVTLARDTTDGFGDPAPRLSFGYSERDRKTMAHAKEFFPSQASAMDADPSAARKRQGWRAHPSGTCRMGFDDASAVVDRNNRVFGVTNLYVSGACTFPTSGTANPTLTVVALTLRLSDHLVSVLRA